MSAGVAAHLHHYRLLILAGRRVLQEGELGQLAGLVRIAECVALAGPVLGVVVETAVGALQLRHHFHSFLLP